MCFFFTDSPNVEIKIKGVAGESTVKMTMNEWVSASPAGRVLKLHELGRDSTQGQPFEILNISGVQ